VKERNEKETVRPSAVILGELTKKPIFAQSGSEELYTNNEKQRALDGVGKTHAHSGAEQTTGSGEALQEQIELAAFHPSHVARRKLKNKTQYHCDKLLQ
jgi:hypothetical protein